MLRFLQKNDKSKLNKNSWRGCKKQGKKSYANKLFLREEFLNLRIIRLGQFSKEFSKKKMVVLQEDQIKIHNLQE
jgi:hypothetical protein